MHPSQRSILIADDSSTVRGVVTHAFAGTEVEVLTAADGRSALETALRQRPAVAILDVVMPGLNGYEVAEALSRQGADDVLVVLLSGAYEPFDPERAASCGAAAHLEKPFEKKALLGTVEQVLEQRPEARSSAGLVGEELSTGEPLPIPEVITEEIPKAPAPAVPLPGEEGFDLLPSPPPSASGDPAPLSGELREEARRRIEQLAPEIVREVAWEVVPDLLERLLREAAPAATEKAGEKRK